MDFAELFDQDSMVRNMVEHEILPTDFFEEPMQYMAALAIKKEELIAELYNVVTPGRYKPEQFKFKPLAAGEMIYAVIRTPEPEYPLNCSFIAFGTDKKGRNAVYYTVEKRHDGGFYLCVRHDMEMHTILEAECGTTLREKLKALLDELTGKSNI